MHTKRTALALLCLTAGAAHALQPPQFFNWSHKYDVPENIAIAVASVSAMSLHNMLVRHGRTDSAQAFSILHSDGNGGWSCEVFIGPTDDRSAALAHELRHCHGWVHQ